MTENKLVFKGRNMEDPKKPEGQEDPKPDQIKVYSKKAIEDIDELKEENKKLKERLEKLEGGGVKAVDKDPNSILGLFDPGEKDKGDE